MRSRTLFLLTVLPFFFPSIVRSEPVVAGCQVAPYAAVPYPQSFTFAPDGTIYAGSDSHQGDTHPDPVFRIAPGGAPVTAYGNMYISEDSEGRILKVVPDVSAVEPWTGTPALAPGSVSAAPNPFRRDTAIRLDLVRAERAIDVGIFDLGGRLVRSLHSGMLGAGEHRIPWDGLDTGGREAADGIYLVRVQSQGLRIGTKIVLLK
jgi:hypothetical protein